MAIVEKQPKYKLITSKIKQDIVSGKIKPGSFLPSQAELMNEYKVALGTVRQAINLLVAEGWATTKQGKGIIANIPDKIEDNKRLDTIGFAVIGEYSEYDPVNQMMLQSASKVIREAGKETSYGVFPLTSQANKEDFTRFIDNVGGVILCERVSEWILDLIRIKDVNAVVIGDYIDCSDKEVHQVYADTESAGSYAVQILKVAGHRKVAFLKQLDTNYYRKIQNGMEEACRSCGMSFEVFEIPNREAEVQVADVLSKDVDWTGVIVVGDMHACRLIKDLSERGIDVPEDKSVVSIGGLPRTSLIYPNLTRIDTGYEEMGAESAKILLNTYMHKVRRVLPVKVEFGDTVDKPTGRGKRVVVRSPQRREIERMFKKVFGKEGVKVLRKEAEKVLGFEE